ncbi:MAG: peptide-binding protein [Syntrophus sp. (in: bacteria)]|nr:peptide-binding protein [Syntrophus sp. (in: bacteria)]
MRLRRRTSTVFIALLLTYFLLSGLGCNNKDRTKRTDTITVAFPSEPHTLNPVFLSDLNSYVISGWIFNGLTKLDRNLNIIGDLAESWDQSKDGLKLIFHLRRGVVWHDGKEMTSKDVVFTYRTITSTAVSTPHSAQFGPVKDVSAPDPYTVEILYKQPFGSALISWTIGIIPEHIFNHQDIDNSPFNRLPVGTGPYKLKEWVPGQQLVLESFDGHFVGSPKTRRIVVKIIPDPTTRFLELKTGNVDLIESSPVQFGKLANTDNLSRSFNKYRSPSFRYGFLGFNLLDRRFQDIRVRQAISHGIDKNAIVEAVLFGFGDRAAGPYPLISPYANTRAPRFDYDPAKAAQLFNEAGWRRGNDGVLQKDGHAFSFTILTNFESEDNIKAAQIIQSNLKALGVNAKVSQIEWQTFRHTVIRNREFEAIVLSRAYIWDPDLFDLWHSSKTTNGDWNFLSYKSPEVDRLLEQGRTTADLGKRKTIYRQVHEIIAIDQPCVFLYNADGLFIAHKRIQGIAPSPIGIFHNIAEFSISP